MKRYRYLLLSIAILVLAYFSIEVKALDEVKQSLAATFDAKAYARDFLDKKLAPVLPQAIGLPELLSKLSQNKDETFEKYSHAVSIGNLRNFLVQGEGKVTEIQENEVLMALNNTEPTQVIHLATEFIYGNSIRDAAGLFDIKNFANSNDINSIAAEINRIIRSEVVPPFRKQVKVGDTVHFTGALELNQARLNTRQLEILPIQLSLK
jgi:predicted lipoprotein